MAGTDSFESSHDGTGSFRAKASPSSSDSFVRSVTQPLVKKGTKSLELNSDALERQIAGMQEQIQLCRTILDRFEPRMRLLQAAAEPPKQPSPQPKPLELRKKQNPPSTRPPSLTPQERLLVANISQRLQMKSDLARRVAIAIVQFTDAERHVSEAHAKLSEVRSMDLEQACSIIETIEVSKLQGRIYPLCNFHEVFKDDELMRQLFPQPDSPAMRSSGR